MESKSLRMNQTYVVKAKPGTVQKKFVIKHIKPSAGNNVQVQSSSTQSRHASNHTPQKPQKMVQVTIPTVHLNQGAEFGRCKGSLVKKYSLNVPLIQVNIPRLEVSKITFFSSAHLFLSSDLEISVCTKNALQLNSLTHFEFLSLKL